MKTKKNKKDIKEIFTFCIRLNKEEREIFTKLKEIHGVNVSGAIKIALKEKLNQLEKIK